MPDYRDYRLSFREKALCFLLSVSVGLIISWLFYRSLFGMAVLLILHPIIKNRMKTERQKLRSQKLRSQFGEILQMTVTALKSGYSMENAFKEGWKDFTALYGNKEIMAQEFEHLNRQVQLNVSLEQALEEFAERSGLEEVESFVQVFRFAKRSGGNVTGVFEDTVRKIREKAEVLREIDLVLISKKLEQRIMNLVPFGILLYVGITSPDFLNGLYGNFLGAAVMTGSLLLYAAAYWMSYKIMDIQV